MSLYRVELTAWVEATWCAEITADSKEHAEAIALQLHPRGTGSWTVLPKGTVINVAVFETEER